MKYFVTIVYAIFFFYFVDKADFEKNWVYLITVGPLFMGSTLALLTMMDKKKTK
ncbi:hypothetical protein SAMN05421503_1498 [Terribacillus aidingensis]|uniref:Uncharacterized protein n=1 Tax=Terribacillus aidingensis TaxID=586416 RepID=A0A285NM92_9BACI|nr:hypothetical protein [Terribacillus aidingensis]SNZ10043.1 hypothetical protein SAMN05421503_1498 [Terribacillus aidingensis]